MPTFWAWSVFIQWDFVFWTEELFVYFLSGTFCDDPPIPTPDLDLSSPWDGITRIPLNTVSLDKCFSTFFDSRHPSLVFNNLAAPLSAFY